jgi:cytochrome c-type biogenesis protein
MNTDVSLVAALGAGILSSASPCVLPLVPAYLGFLTGSTMEEMADNDMPFVRAKGRMLWIACCFVLGFSTVFVGLGATASAFGQLLHRWSEPLAVIAGALIILMGLHFLGLKRFATLYREARFNTFQAKAGPVGAYLMGLAFAFGWTPCIGPVLAAILTVAGSRGSVGTGAVLLGAYSVGLGIPFLVAALFAARFGLFLRGFRAHFPKVERAMGLVLVVAGVMFLTGGMQRLSFWLLETFPGLANIG